MTAGSGFSPLLDTDHSSVLFFFFKARIVLIQWVCLWLTPESRPLWPYSGILFVALCKWDQRVFTFQFLTWEYKGNLYKKKEKDNTITVVKQNPCSHIMLHHSVEPIFKVCTCAVVSADSGAFPKRRSLSSGKQLCDRHGVRRLLWWPSVFWSPFSQFKL